MPAIRYLLANHFCNETLNHLPLINMHLFSRFDIIHIKSLPYAGTCLAVSTGDSTAVQAQRASKRQTSLQECRAYLRVSGSSINPVPRLASGQRSSTPALASTRAYKQP